MAHANKIASSSDSRNRRPSVASRSSQEGLCYCWAGADRLEVSSGAVRWGWESRLDLRAERMGGSAAAEALEDALALQTAACAKQTAMISLVRMGDGIPAEMMVVFAAICSL